ncbi:MAG TPA: branched-chain amino acid ABC transporter permease [Tepidisphaeraceae bacterium]|jgi:branched-chain amino acid transport system permease protein
MVATETTALPYAAPTPQGGVSTWLAPLLIVALAVLLHQTIGRFLGDYIERVAIDVGIAIVMAVSLNIVNGYTGQFSIGHAAFFAIGGYAAATVTYYASLLIWNSTTAVDLQTAGSFSGIGMTQSTLFVVATILGGLLAAAAGWVVGLPSLRLRGDYLAIVTLGFGEILRVLLQQTNKQLYSLDEVRAAKITELFPPPVGGALGFINVPKNTTVFWVFIAVGITIVFAWRLKRSTFGRAMIAIRENEIAAESMGVNVTKLKVRAFVFAAFFAGVAGSLYAHQTGTQINPAEGGFQRSFDIVIMVVLGGLGSISGAVLAALILTVANEWLRDPTAPFSFFGYDVQLWQIMLLVMVTRLLIWPANRLKALLFWGIAIACIEMLRQLSLRYGIALGDYRMIIYALTLILMMILRPSGLFGMSEITDLPKMRRQIQPQPAPQGFPV